MVEIFSKRNEPGRDEARFRKVVQENRSTIVRLADQLSQGAYSASKRPKPAPQPEGLIIHVGAGPAKPDIVDPHVRVSHNSRVILMDLTSGRQLEHLGELRRFGDALCFVLATRENGFFSPLDDDIVGRLADLDGIYIDTDFPEERLCATLVDRLLDDADAAGMAETEPGQIPD
ncbi:hypothetical protein [Amorphus sp. 3PC139-8]|uniref:hypothetical protein n=1 Tax=Amorphus sp. 3PC139-8 TaxID=2735676 RepID=UPI00345CE14A